jgi:hypothetical protein
LYGGGAISYSINNPFNAVSPSIDPILRSEVPLDNDLFPAQVYGGPIGNNVGTFLVAYSGFYIGNSSYFFIVALEDPLTSPSFSWNNVVDLGEIDQEQSVSSTPPNAPQIGLATNVLGTYSTFVTGVAWRDNSLWVTAQVVPFVGPNAGQTTAVWFQINTDTVNKKFTLVDSGEIGGEDLGAGTFTFFPFVAVNSRGVAAFGFAASGPLIHPGAYVVGRNPNDPKGTVSRSFVVKEGIDVYNGTKWGIQSSIALDPADDSFWVYNEFAGTHFLHTDSTGVTLEGAWGTAWRRFRSTDCTDGAGTFYVTALKANKDCKWLSGATGVRGQPNYKRILCQPLAAYSASRLLCAKTCGICVGNPPSPPKPPNP